MDVPKKRIPVRWVVERDAADPAPMLINASDFDPARHRPLEDAPVAEAPAVDESREAVPAEDAASDAPAEAPRRGRRSR